MDAWFFTEEGKSLDKKLRAKHSDWYVPTEVKHCWVCVRERSTVRCHVIADSLGGTVDPLNFVLLCRQCHEKAPDTTQPAILFDWIILERRESLKRRLEDFYESMRDRKKWFPHFPPSQESPQHGEIFFDKEHEKRLREIQRSKEFEDYLFINGTIHFGVGMKWSTYYSLLSVFEAGITDLSSLTFSNN